MPIHRQGTSTKHVPEVDAVNMGYIVKAMLAWADIIVIDYGSSRLVHAVGLGYPERTAVSSRQLCCSTP